MNNNDRVNELRKEREIEKQWRSLQAVKRINRCYEVEEHMGNEFIEELAKLHQEHLNYLKNKLAFSFDIENMTQKEQQKSLPAYVYGRKLAEMVKNLEEIKCLGKGELRGGGKILYD